MCAFTLYTSNNGRQQFLQLSLTQHHRFYSQDDDNDGCLRKKSFPGAAFATAADTRMPG